MMMSNHFSSRKIDDSSKCEISDHNSSSSSNNNNELLFTSSLSEAAKRVRYEENGAGGGLHKFKGVVPQQNGHWGAQIYANHQRIWLGTFKSEREAAMAYDSATIKLRSGESHRNFPWNDETVQEPHFQRHYTTQAVLAMIRDGSYPSKFATFLGHKKQGEEDQVAVVGGVVSDDKNIIRVKGSGEQFFSCTQLFQKELTPSDVGKLNRLVIPKKHALTYFPNNNSKKDEIDIEVVFYDKLMRSWKFRYCYWKSSQSYVFTRGWNRFVKDNRLKPKDIIAFYLCEPMIMRRRKNGEEGGEQQPHVFSLIDVIYTSADAADAAQDDDEMMMMRHSNNNCFGGGDNDKNIKREVENEEDINKMRMEDGEDGMDLNEDGAERSAPKGLRLFGVCINIEP